MAKRAKDAITAATTAILKPAAREWGFRPVGDRTFARIVDDCLVQSFHLQVSGYGGRLFAVNCAVMPLCRPPDGWALSWGGRLGGSLSRGEGDRWWEGATHEDADASMIEVVALLRTDALPHFDAYGSASRFVERLRAQDFPLNGHQAFDLGCVEAWREEVHAAAATLQVAIEHYERDYCKSRALGLDRTWTLTYRDKAQHLLDAVARGTHRVILTNWVAASRAALKLA